MSSPLPRYIFRRGNTLYLKLQRPGQSVLERSLGTNDPNVAEIAALPLIRQHKILMHQRRLDRLPRVTEAWVSAYPTFGLQIIDGKQVFVTERELRDPTTGAVIGANGGPAEILTPAPLDGMPSWEAFDQTKARPTPAVKNTDDDLLETYLKHKGIAGQREKQARDIWHTFKTVVGKPISKCSRDDGRALVAYLVEQAGGKDKIKSATLRRRMAVLVAFGNFAIKEGKLTTVNPFAGCVPSPKAAKDADKRKAFTDDDMVLIRANLHKLSKDDQRLVRLLATTGMRRGEAFEIDSEQSEDGVRFCVVGTKTDASLRRVPFPADLLDFLPDKITSQLIPGRLDSASKRLREWLTGIGIADPDKAPMHSFRHRAVRRLRKAGVQQDIRRAIGGWAGGETKDAASEEENYGVEDAGDKGYPMPMLKEAIDKIGF